MPDYAGETYLALKDAYGNQFSKTEDEYRKALSEDPNYYKEVHGALKDAYGDQFDKDESTFYQALGLKATPQPSGAKKKYSYEYKLFGR